jgi:hypothetical protein
MLPEVGYWKDFLDYYQIRDLFQEESRNLSKFFLTKRQANIVKSISAHTKSTELIFRILKKSSSRETIPLKAYKNVC